MTTIDNYRTQVETMERDAGSVGGRDREILAACAGQFADQLGGAVWTSQAAREEGFALAARARKVERNLLAALAADLHR